MEILILFLLILLNGFFALSEIALVSAKPARPNESEISFGRKYVLKLLENPENFLSAIQVGITLIGIVTGVYGGMNIADDVAPLLLQIGVPTEIADETALTLTVIVITYVSIVLGELVPKVIALSNPDSVAIKVAPIIYSFSRLFYPFVIVLSISTGVFKKILHIKPHREQITEDELRRMIKLASDEGVIEKEQNQMHEKLFYFADKKAKHIMTHRTDLERVNITKANEEIKHILERSHHSKLVCYNSDSDDFVGIIYQKEFFRRYADNHNFPIDEIIKVPLYVPENIDAQKVLSMFKKQKVHICCVVNEYGGFEGLITLHDIMENIVGHIPEDSDDEPDIFIREDKSVLVAGDAPIETLAEFIPNFIVDFHKINYSTVAGFIINKLDKLPQTGDKLCFDHHTFEIIDMDGPKIDKILVTKE